MAKILVIEDDDDVRETVHDMLELNGFEVAVAADGMQGLSCVRETAPDLIVCDVAMPNMDGFDVLEFLRQNALTLKQTRHIPVIFLTAKTERENVRHGMELGADDYITKPFTESELVQSIRARLLRVK